MYLNPGCTAEPINVLIQSVDAVLVWMRKNILQLNPDKTERLWLFGRPEFWMFFYFQSWMGLHFMQELVQNVGVLLDTQFLLLEQIVAVAKAIFAQVYLTYQLCLLLDQEYFSWLLSL